MDLGWALNPINGVLIRERKGRFKAQTQRGKGHVKMEAEAEIGVMSQAKESLEPPEAGRGNEAISPRGFRGRMALLTPSFQDSGQQNCERIHFSCLKPPSLWYSVMAVLGK